MVILDKMVFYPCHCIEMKPGERATGSETRVVAVLLRLPGTASASGTRGNGVWRTRSISAPHPWYGSGTTVTPLFYRLWAKQGKLGISVIFRKILSLRPGRGRPVVNSGVNCGVSCGVCRGVNCGVCRGVSFDVFSVSFLSFSRNSPLKRASF